MSFSNLSSVQIRRLVELVKEKEGLLSKLERIDAALSGLESGGTTTRRRGRKPGPVAGARAGRRKGKRGKRLKEPLLHALKAAGSSGITVRDLATKLKVKPGNIFSWFYTTGKKVKGISKVGEARYAYSDKG